MHVERMQGFTAWWGAAPGTKLLKQQPVFR